MQKVLKSKNMDMLNGPVFKKVLVFVIPLILSSILQLLYNAADLIVVGRWAGEQALAAVGATTSLVGLFTQTFISVSIGANVVVARCVGAKDEPGMNRASHTSVLFGVLSGIGIGIITFAGARVFLGAMDTPADIIDKSVLYIRIIAIGMPFSMLYNFGAAVLRAVGETKKPMYILAISGVANVILNLFFVIVVGIDVAGVAIGTIASQILSSIMVVVCLVRRKDASRLELKKLRIYKDQLATILKIGLPAGLQAILFNVSNVLIQSTVNSFGTTVVAGNTAALNLEVFMYTSANCMMQTTVTFCGQNIGARKYSRLGMIVRTCALTVVGMIFIMGGAMILLRYPLLSLYTKELAVAEVGARRLMLIIPVYFTCGILETTVGGLRSLGKSLTSMLITVIGVCGLRLVVLYVFFPIWPVLDTLYISYPVSWLVTALAQLTAFLIVKRRLPADGIEYKA